MNAYENLFGKKKKRKEDWKELSEDGKIKLTLILLMWRIG
jgi:hypothetical protein